MSEKWFALRPVDCPLLQEEKFRVVQTETERRLIRTMRDLRSVLHTGGGGTVVLFRREDIHQRLMQHITDRWGTVCNVSVRNAMPHVHPETTCHAAPEPTECPTAFFRSGDVLQAVRRIIDDSRYADISPHFQMILHAADTGGMAAFFYALHSLENNTKGAVPKTLLLDCIQDIQRRVAESGGKTGMSLAEDGYGIVSIPPGAVHCRDAEWTRARETVTRWKQFDRI